MTIVNVVYCRTDVATFSMMFCQLNVVVVVVVLI